MVYAFLGVWFLGSIKEFLDQTSGFYPDPPWIKAIAIIFWPIITICGLFYMAYDEVKFRIKK